MQIRIVLASLFLGACGQAADPYVVTEARGHLVNPALQVYVDEFAQVFGQAVPGIPISIGPLETGVAGKCYTPGNKGAADQVADSFMGPSTQSQKRVVISQSYFARNKEMHDKVQIVVFHELAHCILGRGHRETMMDTDDYGEIPRSIMHPKGSFGDQPYYREYYKHYIKELFGTNQADKDVPGNAVSKMKLETQPEADHETPSCVEYID